MGYAKLITYGKYAELFQYERDMVQRADARRLLANRREQGMVIHRQNLLGEEKPQSVKRADNAKRSQHSFARLISANLGEYDVPVLFSLTYAENIVEIRQGHEDFKSFARLVRNKVERSIRYVAVAEFQRRGAIHFHALFWGIPPELVKSERSTRFFSGLWKQGFVDLVKTDGSEKLAGYLGKYMAKAFVDKRLYACKAYIASRNIKRPEIIRDVLKIQVRFQYELSTGKVLNESNYMTRWLGECNYKLFGL